MFIYVLFKNRFWFCFLCMLFLLLTLCHSLYCIAFIGSFPSAWRTTFLIYFCEVWWWYILSVCLKNLSFAIVCEKFHFVWISSELLIVSQNLGTVPLPLASCHFCWGSRRQSDGSCVTVFSLWLLAEKPFCHGTWKHWKCRHRYNDTPCFCHPPSRKYPCFSSLASLVLGCFAMSFWYKCVCKRLEQVRV